MSPTLGVPVRAPAATGGRPATEPASACVWLDRVETVELVVDAFDRVRQSVRSVLDGLDADELHDRLDGDSNSIAWLVWHLTRVQDDHVAGAAAHEQVWTADGWVERFALPFPPETHGYGHE